MPGGTVTWAERDGVATITLCRPGVLNALNRPMAEELLELLRRAATEERVRSVLLTGAGRAFLAGQDLGVVNEIRAGGSFSRSDIARRLATGPTAAFGAAKRVMHRGIQLCLDEALALEGAVQDVVAATEDAHEGVAAFLDKRRPKFQGR